MKQLSKASIPVATFRSDREMTWLDDEFVRNCKEDGQDLEEVEFVTEVKLLDAKKSKV